MSFSTIQLRKLQRDVKTTDIRTREVNGRELSYIEGWHAIAEANRIKPRPIVPGKLTDAFPGQLSTDKRLV